MTTSALIATKPGASLSRPCRFCGKPITLRQLASGQWVPFEVDPVVLKVTGNPIGSGTLEMLDSADQHECGRNT